MCSLENIEQSCKYDVGQNVKEPLKVNRILTLIGDVIQLSHIKIDVFCVITAVVYLYVSTPHACNKWEYSIIIQVQVHYLLSFYAELLYVVISIQSTYEKPKQLEVFSWFVVTLHKKQQIPPINKTKTSELSTQFEHITLKVRSIRRHILLEIQYRRFH